MRSLGASSFRTELNLAHLQLKIPCAGYGLAPAVAAVGAGWICGALKCCSGPPPGPWACLYPVAIDTSGSLRNFTPPTARGRRH